MRLPSRPLGEGGLMDRDVTVRFYEISPVSTGQAAAEQVLRKIYNLHANDREKDVGTVLRLETLDDRSGLLVGDITRVQRENLPSHVTDDATDPLPVDQIGHHAAFCLEPETNYIALQYDQKIGINRFANYLGQFVSGAAFGYLPVLNQDGLVRFGKETPQRLTLRISKIKNFKKVRHEVTDFEEALERFSDLWDAPTIEITLQNTGTDGSIDRARTLNTIRRWLKFKEEIGGIRKIEGKTLETDDAFNFINQLLKESATLDLPNNDVQKGRRMRVDYAQSCYDKHRGFLRGLAGLE
jgi:hypothetical protein